jgi:predicted AlkP superfamily phosphohydrolase/phosphomutase
MIALDAAEPRLVEQWMKDGTLPNLNRLQTRGCYGRLESTADWLAGSPWPTFYTGTSPASHGLYHSLQWRADLMRLVPPTPDWLPLQPFWRDLSEKGHRVVAVDMPMTYAPEAFNGVEVNGWASHDRLMPPASYPPSTMRWVRQEFGVQPFAPEICKREPKKSLFMLRNQLIQATSRVTDLVQALMRREAWDLFLVAFGATHRGGHKLWDLSGILGKTRLEDRVELSHALRDVYVSCDRAVGQIIKEAGDDVTTFVFSLHGMGPNTSRAQLMPTMLARVLGQETGYKKTKGQSPRERILGLRKYLPLAWRDKVSRLLMLSLQEKLTTFQHPEHQFNGIDWNVTPAFSLTADLQGYIRINLRGREAAGIVEPGKDYDQLCDDIKDGFGTFVDAHTGKPIVESVVRSDKHFATGCRLNCLPDLIVRWSSSPSANHKEITSAQYGSIRWDTPGLNPDGRGGNHRPKGFLLATGRNIKPQSRLSGAHILDLAPTVYALFNLPKPADFCGNVLSEIAS